MKHQGKGCGITMVRVCRAPEPAMKHPVREERFWKWKLKKDDGHCFASVLLITSFLYIKDYVTDETTM